MATIHFLELHSRWRCSKHTISTFSELFEPYFIAFNAQHSSFMILSKVYFPYVHDGVFTCEIPSDAEKEFYTIVLLNALIRR
mgnify:CR=1 FL=1